MAETARRSLYGAARFAFAKIGAGLSGTSLAFVLVKFTGPDMRILVFARRPHAGFGLAYSPQDTANWLDA